MEKISLKLAEWPRVAGPALALCGFLLAAFIYYPGIFTPDSLDQFDQSKTGAFSDGHPPIMAALWFLLNRIHTGPELIFLLHLVLFWTGMWAVSDGLRRCGVRMGGLFVLLGFLPFVFNFVGLLWKDVALASAWLLAIGLTFRRRAANEKLSPLEIALVTIAFFYGALVRANSIFGAAPLALWLLNGDLFSRKLWPQLAAAVLAPALVLASTAGFSAAVRAEQDHLIGGLYLFDLGGISRAENTNFVPGPWTPQQAALIRSCYGVDRWDYLTEGRCSFVGDALDRSDLLGSPELHQAWQHAILTHPADYLAHRLRFTNSILRWLGPIPVHDSFMETEITDLRYQNRPGPIFRLYEDICEGMASTPLFRPYFWLVIAFSTLALSWFAQDSPSRRFAAALSASSIFYLLTYSIFGIASDFRYSYWSIIAVLAAGSALSGCAWTSRKQLQITLGASGAVLALAVAASVLSG